MADSSIIENLSEGVLTAFFGSFLGAAVGKDLAGITVNLLSSGIEKIGAKTFETITQDRTNHDIQKLASASLHASVNDVLSESNDVGGKVTWRDSQKKALSELREYSKNQFMSESDVAGRIVSATMVGLSAEVENSVRQMIQPFLEQKDTIDKERLTQEISKRFFFNFNELYKSEKHEKGRLAIERDIARTLLQGLNSQTAIIADFKQKNQSQYETVVRLLDGIVTTGLTDWNPNFDKVINAVNNLATESKEQIRSATTEIKSHTASEIENVLEELNGLSSRLDSHLDQRNRNLLGSVPDVGYLQESSIEDRSRLDADRATRTAVKEAREILNLFGQLVQLVNAGEQQSPTGIDVQQKINSAVQVWMGSLTLLVSCPAFQGRSEVENAVNELFGIVRNLINGKQGRLSDMSQSILNLERVVVSILSSESN
jgi:hypothetical protein